MRARITVLVFELAGERSAEPGAQRDRWDQLARDLDRDRLDRDLAAEGDVRTQNPAGRDADVARRELARRLQAMRAERQLPTERARHRPRPLHASPGAGFRCVRAPLRRRHRHAGGDAVGRLRVGGGRGSASTRSYSRTRATRQNGPSAASISP